MIAFIEELRIRNEALYYFGLVCLGLSGLFLLLSFLTDTQVYNISAWYKPMKFSLSTWLFVWAMGWYCYYLRDFNTLPFNYSTIVLLGFEILYIAIQAGRGQLSHFNIGSPFSSVMYSLMALAATSVTVYTAYIGYLFFTSEFPGLPDYYVSSIRWGIVIFVVFAFEGFVMGSKLTHTIGGPDGGIGIRFLNWSTKYGDPRVSHFIGMHALQSLPIISWYILKNRTYTTVAIVLYAMLAVFTLFQALQGRPFFKINEVKKETHQTWNNT
jgi:hypothetical protein